jgi:hypothetical protein
VRLRSAMSWSFTARAIVLPLGAHRVTALRRSAAMQGRQPVRNGFV